jgi:hypothetical protein
VYASRFGVLVFRCLADEPFFYIHLKFLPVSLSLPMDEIH